MNEKQHHERFYYAPDHVMEKPFNWAQMRRLLGYLKPYAKKLLPLAAIAVIVGTAVRVAVPRLVGLTIDQPIASNNMPALMGMVILIAVLYAVLWLSNVFRVRWTNVLGHSVIYDLRADLFRHVQRLSHRFFDQRSAGSVLVRITNDVSSLSELFTNGVVNLLMDFLLLAGITVTLFVLNWKLALAVMVIIPIMFVISTNFRKRVRRSWQHVRLQQSQINSHLNESIQGIRVTQSFTQEGENIDFFDRMNRRNHDAWIHATRKSSLFRPLVELAGAIGTAILIWYGAYLVSTPDLSIGVFVSFAVYVGMFWEPISRLGQFYNMLLIGMASSERIFEFLDEEPSVPEKRDALSLPAVQGDVRLHDVTFSYDEERKALDGISLHMEAGSKVALVGHTGSGKTSIVNLICRFYDPTAGRVTLDGTDLRDLKLDELRSQVSIVLQDTFIFSGTIMENIRFGRPEASDDEVKIASRAVGADSFIQRLPNGYDTEVEERGSALSQGERQLLSFARALLADPQILILDEATASIDTETEMKIQEAMETLLAGRTAILIAHRLSTIREADQIIVLENGQIIERGDHQTLMSQQGEYYSLVRSQFKTLEAG